MVVAHTSQQRGHSLLALMSCRCKEAIRGIGWGKGRNQGAQGQVGKVGAGTGSGRGGQWCTCMWQYPMLLPYLPFPPLIHLASAPTKWLAQNQGDPLMKQSLFSE